MFQFNQDYILQNEIAELIPANLDHREEIYKCSLDQSIWEHFTEEGYGEENFNSYFDRALKYRDIKQQYTFVIKDLRKNKFAGMTRIYDVDNDLRNVKVGHTWIGTEFQKTGLNKACKFLLFEFLFEKIGMERIGFGASSANVNSINAMKSVGCSIEGELRGFLPVPNSNQRLSIILLSILKKDWDKSLKSNLKKKLQVIKA